MKNKDLILHVFVLMVMYGYYLWLWKEYLFYDGKAGWKGFGLFIETIVTAPIYIIFHLAVLYFLKQEGIKRGAKLSLIGLGLCIIHVLAVIAIV